MALFVTDTGKRSELQEKLAAELREKMARSSDDGGEKLKAKLDEEPDYVEDSAYIQSYQKSKPIPRVAIILIVAVIILVAAGLVYTLTK